MLTGGIEHALVNDERKFCLGQNKVFIRPSNVFPLYLFDLLNSEVGCSKMNDAVAVGVQPSLSLNAIKPLKIPLPPIEEQAKIFNAIHIMNRKLFSLMLSKKY